jgi:hypothetical protein
MSAPIREWATSAPHLIEVQRDIKSRRLQRATVARDDLWLGNSLRIGPYVMLAVFILVQRVILGSYGVANPSLGGGLFIGVDVLAVGILLRPSTR